MNQRNRLFFLLLSLLVCCGTVCAQGTKGENEGVQPKEESKPKPPTPRPPRRQPVPANVPKPAAKPIYAELTVKTNMPGCAVLVDGVAKGLTNESGFLNVTQLKPGQSIITISKAGYVPEEGTLNLSPGETRAVNIVLKPMPGKLNVKPNVTGAKIEVDGTEYNETVSELALPAGRHKIEVTKAGYRSVTRDVDIKPAEVTNINIPLEPIPVEELLTQVEADFLERRYIKVIESCKKILVTNPDQPRANLLLGQCYYNSDDYLNSIPYLAKAISMGEEFRMNITHRHKGGANILDISGKILSEDLCEGVIILRKNSFEFQSSSTTKLSKSSGKHDFQIPYRKIMELNPTFAKDQLGMKISLTDNSKEKAKPYDFFPEQATLVSNSRDGAEIRCSNCKHTTQVLYKLLQQLK